MVLPASLAPITGRPSSLISYSVALISQESSSLALFLIIAYPDAGTGQEATSAVVPSLALPFSKSVLVGTTPVLA